MLVEDRGYITKTDPVHADVALTLFGRGCGSVKTDFTRVPNSTKAFLQVRDAEVLVALRSIDYARFYNHVAFIEGLSLKEVRFLLNEYFDARG